MNALQAVSDLCFVLKFTVDIIQSKSIKLLEIKNIVGANIIATMGNTTISLQISFFLTCNKNRLLKFTKHLKNKLN